MARVSLALLETCCSLLREEDPPPVAPEVPMAVADCDWEVEAEDAMASRADSALKV